VIPDDAFRSHSGSRTSEIAVFVLSNNESRHGGGWRFCWTFCGGSVGGSVGGSMEVLLEVLWRFC